MKWSITCVVAAALCEVLVAASGGIRSSDLPSVPSPNPVRPLAQQLQRPYLDLFRDAATFNYTAADLQNMRTALQQAQESCVKAFKRRRDELRQQLEKAQSELKRDTSKLSDEQRHRLHCRIQELRVLEEQADVLANSAIPVAYDNRLAKLDLIRDWPVQLILIEGQIANGSYHSRRWGDVKDVGFRRIEKNQKDDIKVGQDAIRQMKLAGLMPKEVEEKAVVDYVKRVGENLAAHSDLQVPLNITVLDTKEINAFAFPGGYLFIERGLLEAVDNESELAGVIAHEMSHVVARHGKRLMKKGTIASIFFQAAQIAAMVLTGGVAGIGTYYALQYGFYGLGLVLNLQLLGVSRDYEMEADQLGIQYAWNAGYSPDGFIQFFDKIATKEGYINGASWFRTHPPFYQRMADAEREITYLPAKDKLAIHSAAFEEMKAALTRVTAKAQQEEKGRPSLLSAEQGCAAPLRRRLSTSPANPSRPYAQAP